MKLVDLTGIIFIATFLLFGWVCLQFILAPTRRHERHLSLQEKLYRMRWQIALIVIGAIITSVLSFFMTLN